MPRPSNQPRAAQSDRPPIWVDGRQQPRFDPRAWLRVGQVMARRWLVPHLGATSDHLGALAEQIAAGRFALPLTRLGKAAQHLPSRDGVSRTVLGLAKRVAAARLILDPAPDAPEPLAYTEVLRGTALQPPVTIAPPAPPPRPTQAEEPTLVAIRAVLRSQPEAALPPARPVFDLPKKETTRSPVRLFLERCVSHMIAWGALTLALPVGLAQALLFHLNGGDLTDWD